MKKIDILLVEDHPIYLDGLLAILSRQDLNLNCIATRDADSALSYLNRGHNIDLVIADYRLPNDMDGLALLTRIGSLYPSVGRILMSGGDDLRISSAAQRAGVLGYVSKQLDATKWLRALDTVLSGSTYFPQLLDAVPQLNDRQAAILQLASSGLGNKQIAQALNLTERTVKYHLSEAFVRLSTSSRTEAVARAASLGWINLDQALTRN